MKKQTLKTQHIKCDNGGGTQTKTGETEDGLGLLDALGAHRAGGVEEGSDLLGREVEEVAVRADVAVGVLSGGGRQTRRTYGLLVAEAVEIRLLLALLADSHVEV